jgi:hypothetical protein
MADKPAFGVFPQMKPRRSQQDREAAKNVPVDLARGFVSGTLGAPGDIEALARLPYELITGNESPTILPTSADIEKRLPLRSDSPLSRAATGLGQIGGGFYTGPLSGARAVTAIPKAVGKAGRDFVMAAGQPAVNVVKPKGGNFLTDRLGRELQYLKPTDIINSREMQYGPEMEKAVRERIAQLKNDVATPGYQGGGQRVIDRLQQKLDSGEIAKKGAISKWVDTNLTNYIKNQMATPEDPVRLMLDKRTGEIEAKFAKDMERADRLAERAAAETDPRMKGNLTRNAEQAKMAAEMERDLAMSHMLPSQYSLTGFARQAAGESRLNRAVEGFPEEGMAKTPAGKAWEDITDSDMGVTANRAGDAQSAVEKKQKTLDAIWAAEKKALEIYDAFMKFLAGKGLGAAEIQDARKTFSTEQKLKYLNNPELTEEYGRLHKAAEDLRGTYRESDLKIAEQYPWVEKLDPETRLYEFYGSHDLGFDHIIDVLKQDVAAGRITPDQLNRMSVDQAVRRAAEFDQEAAKKMREAQIKATEGMPTYKEYPEGYKWIELKAAEGALPEGANIEKIGDIYYIRDDVGNVLSSGATEREAIGLLNREEREQTLGAALKYEGDTMGHCVGGYCPDVMQGKSRIYSLRDAKGEPHVTVEVKPMSDSDFVNSVDWNKYRELQDQDPAAATQWLAEERQKAPSRIHQIKGKANLRPVEKYDQYTQDFVRSGNWSEVRDLGNTGLVDIKTGAFPWSKNTKAEEIDSLIGGMEYGTATPKYKSLDAFRDALTKKAGKRYVTQQEYDDLISQELRPLSPEGMKRGGRVHVSDNCDCQMMEVMDKKLAGGGLAAKIAKLARAPAKSAAEIEAIAQRMAPQVTGEFVRGDKGTTSVAGKPFKQFAREKDLKSAVDFTDIKNAPAIQTLNPEKLQGSVVTGIPGDPTVTGKSLTRVGDIKLESPSPQHGGPLYGLYQPDDAFWASGIGPASGVQRVAKEAMEAYDAPVLGQYIMMGPDSINYAQHFADANLSAIDLSKMSKKQIEQFNKIIRFGDEKSGPRPTFPGIENKEEAYLHLAFDPHLRRHFNKLMQMPTVTEPLNLPSGQDIRFATTEPVLRDLETGVTGFSMGKLDPEVSKSGLKLSSHPTYSHDIPGEFMGGMKYPVPYELSFPDTLKSVRENPKQAGQEFGSLKMVGPRQIYDQQMVDELKQYEEAMKRLTGKKEGGEVKMQAGGLAKLAKSLKATPKKIEAPTVVIPGNISSLKEAVRESKGAYGAKRVERAADEVKNLDKIYKEGALREAFLGDNAKALVNMNPADFEKYALELVKRKNVSPEMARLAQQGEMDKYSSPTDEYVQYLMGLRGGFDDMPYLNLFKDETGIPVAPKVIGHEGRHRSRALAERGEPSSLVMVMPRGGLREELPRRDQEGFIEALRQELDLNNRMVLPESRGADDDLQSIRQKIRLPEPFAKGGTADNGLIKVKNKRKAKG